MTVTYGSKITSKKKNVTPKMRGTDRLWRDSNLTYRPVLYCQSL